VIGASRGIGRETVAAALSAGHTVSAFARHPDSLDIRHPHLKLIRGDVLDPSSVLTAITGQDAVICTLGLQTLKAIGPPIAKRSYILTTGTQNILNAMHQSDVRRLIVVTANGTADSAKNCTPFARLSLHYGLRWLFREKARQEELVRTSGGAWTIIRPSALTNGPETGKFATTPVRAGLFTQVSRRDVAAFIVRILDDPSTYHKAITVSYPPHFGDSLRWIAHTR
jgi:uncharacterized protein YbjT (DUF2867 family)